MKYVKAEMQDTLAVKDMFSFKNNKIDAICKFETVADIFDANKLDVLDNPVLMQYLIDNNEAKQSQTFSVQHMKSENDNIITQEFFMDQQIGRPTLKKGQEGKKKDGKNQMNMPKKGDHPI